MSGLRIVLADTQTVFAQVLAARLVAEPDVESVRIAASRNELLLALVAEPADVLLLDLEIDPDARVALGLLVCERWQQTRVVVIAPETDADADAAAAGVVAGLAGWVSKEVPFAHLLEVLRGVRAGGTHLSPTFLTTVLRAVGKAAQDRSTAGSRLHELSARERQVLTCMSHGMRRAAIAEQLFLSKNTVRSHQQNVLAKLGVHSALEAAALARRAGLVEASAPASDA